jgi:transposase InsO family protein
MIAFRENPHFRAQCSPRASYCRLDRLQNPNRAPIGEPRPASSAWCSVIVKPDTVIAWHRRDFRLFWKWKSRRTRPGRPQIPIHVRELIRRLSRENPLWGAPRIHGELLKLGIDVGQTSVGKYLIRRYLFLALAHDRRRILHFNVTAHPTAEWTSQQLREAFPFDQVPRYLLRDRDGIFGDEFWKDVEAMGIEEVLSAPRSPWQRAYVERVIGTIRRECLDHVIVLNKASLSRHIKSSTEYYHSSRTHLSLAKDSPEPRLVYPPEGWRRGRHSATEPQKGTR